MSKTAGESGVPIPGCDSDATTAVLDVLSDPSNRAILRLLSGQSLTAAEVAADVDIPLSTVYRKLDRLTDTPLLEPTYRFETRSGRHPREYTSNVDQVTVRMPDRPDEDWTVDVG